MFYGSVRILSLLIQGIYIDKMLEVSLILASCTGNLPSLYVNEKDDKI